MAFWRNVNPAGAIADFRSVFREAGHHRWRFAAVAAAVTFGIFSTLASEEHRIQPRPPEVTYITTWEEGRSDAEIIASNQAHQRRKEAIAAEQARREEDVRNIYKTLGRVSGMDVDAIERQAQADRAKEAAAKAAAAAQVRQRQEQAGIAVPQG